VSDQRATSRFAFDRSALLYTIVTLLLGIGALHSQNNLLFIAFGVAIGVLLVNGAYAQASLARLSIERFAPDRGEVGSPLPLRYRAESRSRWLPAAALLIEEVPRSRRDPPWERTPRAAAATVSSRAPVSVSARLVPVRRGELTLDRVDVSSRFPFGAVKKTVRFRKPARILIRPATLTPSSEAFRTLTASPRSSPASLPRAGAGEEMLGLREYGEGDEWRRIAWRASARHGRLVVRESAAPASRASVLELSIAPGSTAEEAEEAISLAAGLLRAAPPRGLRVGLIDPRESEEARVLWSLSAALDALALLDLAQVRAAGDARATLAVEAGEAGPAVRRRRGGARMGAGVAS
jgi:uncharacterized protein (DUF58 family)